MSITPLTVTLSNVSAAEESIVGAKAKRLKELVDQGCKVPKGFCVTVTAFSQAVVGPLEARIEAILSDIKDTSDTKSLAHAASEISELIARTPWPRALEQEIIADYAALCDATGTEHLKVAVRSSAIGEDAKDSSFAGQFETYLGVSGATDLLRHVRKVWASLFTDRALGYRLDRGISFRETPMAVVILELVQADAAGVAFSADPLTSATDRIVIEGNWGFGEAVVQGVVTPDRAIVDKVEDRILSYEVSDKSTISVFDPAQRLVVECPMPKERRNTRVLTEDQTLAIAREVRRLEQVYGYPVDVEWVLSEETDPFLVQVRPISVQRQEPAKTWDPTAFAKKYSFGRGT